MPLYEKVRVEIFLPDLPHSSYEAMGEVLENEFTYTFGGCSVVADVRGHYLSRTGEIVEDRVNLLFTDTSMTMSDRAAVDTYVGYLKKIVSSALQEESILIAVHTVFHG